MLSDAELRVLRALAEALIPPGGPFPLGAGDVGTAERLARYLQRMAPETQGQVRLLLRAWEAAPLASRHLLRLSRLAPAARDAWGERCLASRLPWRRIPLLLLKTLCLSAFCADPRVEAALGYGHECLDGRAPGAGPRLVPLQYPDVRGDVEEVADVCVVGSGAGGAVVGYEPAPAGLRVVVVEAGGCFTPADVPGPRTSSATTSAAAAGASAPSAARATRSRRCTSPTCRPRARRAHASMPVAGWSGSRFRSGAPPASRRCSSSATATPRTAGSGFAPRWSWSPRARSTRRGSSPGAACAIPRSAATFAFIPPSASPATSRRSSSPGAGRSSPTSSTGSRTRTAS